MTQRKPPAPLPDTDDPYVLLDVRPGASSDQIRRAYLRRVKVYKPDRFPAEFRRVREAYDRLREQEAWFDAWRQASEVVREALENSEGESDTYDDDGAPAEPEACEVEDETAVEQSAAIEAAKSEWARIEAEVEREARAEQARVTGSWDEDLDELVRIGDARVDEDPAEEERRRRAEHALTVGARLGDLASAVHDQLEEGRGAEAAALLLELEAEALAAQPAFATLLLEVCCVVVWTEPERYDELVARYGDLVAAHDVEHREGALLHRRTVADEREAWDAAVRDWPELRRFVELGSSLRAPAEAELGLRLGHRAAADATSYLSLLTRAAVAAPGVMNLYSGMADRWARHYGRALPGSRPPAEVPTVDEAAEAVVRELRSHRRVRWLQLRPVLDLVLVAALLLLSTSLLVELLVIGIFVAQWAWRSWARNPLERLYLEVTQPVAARWLWATGASPEALAEAVEERLPAAGTWTAWMHPVDIHGHPRLIANDLALHAFAMTGPMIPRLTQRRSEGH